MGAESNGHRPVEIIEGIDDPDIHRWRPDKLIPVVECMRRDAGHGIEYWVTRFERIGDIVLKNAIDLPDESDKTDVVTEVSLV